MTLQNWHGFKGSIDYRCNCHMGTCYLHGDGADNPARDTFIEELTKELGIPTEPVNMDDYGSETRRQARRILHAADLYVRQVLEQAEGATND